MTRRLLRVTPAAALLAAACATNPATGARQFSLISEAQEIRMGRDYDRDIVASLGLYPDSTLQRYVQELGARLAARSERPNLPWAFRVVDDPVVNAFALPGGFIYVTRGILAHLNSEAELAAVLGHEIGHVTARHSVSQLSRQQLASIGLVLGTVLEPGLERYSGLASAALGVLFLKHGRDDERQADDLGLRYMRRASYDAREMPDLFTMLERVSQEEGGGRVPEWLSTHPNPANRRERIAQQIAALPADSLGTLVNRDRYLGRLDGLVYGDNPREGFFRGARFLHPELRFEITFPEGWTTSNQRQAVLAVSPRKDALVEASLARETTADQAARAFFAQQGVAGDYPARTRVNGLPAVTARFTAQTESGVLRGGVSFVEHGGKTYRLIAYAGEGRWAGYAGVAERALASFARLTDPAALAVQPWRVAVIRPDRDATLEALAGSRPSPVPAASLALINQLQPGATLRAGEPVKWVSGQPLP